MQEHRNGWLSPHQNALCCSNLQRATDSSHLYLLVEHGFINTHLCTYITVIFYISVSIDLSESHPHSLNLSLFL